MAFIFVSCTNLRKVTVSTKMWCFHLLSGAEASVSCSCTSWFIWFIGVFPFLLCRISLVAIHQVSTLSKHKNSDQAQMTWPTVYHYCQVFCFVVVFLQPDILRLPRWWFVRVQQDNLSYCIWYPTLAQSSSVCWSIFCSVFSKDVISSHFQPFLFL